MSGIPIKMLDLLHGPTPPDEVKERQGPGGRTLSYVDARYVMERLDQLGPENWQRDQRAVGDRVACGVGINIEGLGWVWKWDGAGDTDIEGDKGAFSDSFKRAAVNWGIARDLYGLSPTGRSSSSARTAPPAALPPSGEPEPPWPGEEVDESLCPVHAKPWRHSSRGYYCSGKLEDGSWCRQQPSKRWAARQELG
jgi:hypothetical protein